MKNDSITIAGKTWSAQKRVLIIAEAGTGHEGDSDRLEALIREAARAGADAVKFQMVIAREILHPDTGIVELPGGPVRLYDRFRALEKPRSFYETALRLCREAGVIFLCSPFGPESEALLASLEPPAIKIASPELNHFPLIRQAASRGVPLILSTGVSRLRDIEAALSAAKKAPAAALLHCITSYPAPEEEYNLRLISTLSHVFGVPVGISDHSLDPILVPALAVSQGAPVIEKHIGLSREGGGLDDPVALEPDDFARMTEYIRSIEGRTEPEILDGMMQNYGRERIMSCLGNGVKMLAPAERANYGRTNRSIHYMSALPAGHVLTADDVAIFRTEKVLSPGIGPEHLETTIGARLSRPVTNGAGLQWEDLVSRG